MSRRLHAVAIGFLAGLVAAPSGGCTSGARRSTDGKDGRDYVGKDKPVDADALVFELPPEYERFSRARRCFAARGAKWQHYPLREIGNFIQEDWCTGLGAELGCSGSAFRDRSGTDWASLSTLHYPKDFPRVFGVTFSAGHEPDGGWGVSASVSTGGRTVLGEGTHVTFRRAKDETTAIHLGTSYTHEIAEETMRVNAAEPWEVFETLRASPQSLRDEGMRRYEELQTTVVGKLERGMVEKCIYGPYEGDGIPPECVEKVPLTPEEVATERTRIEGEVARIRALLEAHHVEFHALLVELLPPDCV